MARIGRATISRVGALRDSSTRASHHAVPPTAELRTSAVARRQQVKTKKRERDEYAKLIESYSPVEVEEA